MNPIAPIQTGSLLLSLLDPKPGDATGFHRWYERDHFYSGCMLGPGFFAGRRLAAFLRVAFLRVDVFFAAARFFVAFLDVVLRFEDPALRFVDLRRAVTFLAVAILPLPRVS